MEPLKSDKGHKITEDSNKSNDLLNSYYEEIGHNIRNYNTMKLDDNTPIKICVLVNCYEEYKVIQDWRIEQGFQCVYDHTLPDYPFYMSTSFEYRHTAYGYAEIYLRGCVLVDFKYLVDAWGLKTPIYDSEFNLDDYTSVEIADDEIHITQGLDKVTLSKEATKLLNYKITRLAK